MPIIVSLTASCEHRKRVILPILNCVIHLPIEIAFAPDDASRLTTLSSSYSPNRCLAYPIASIVILIESIQTNQSLSFPPQNDAAENAVRHEPTGRRSTGRFREWQSGWNKSPLSATISQKVFVAKKGWSGRPGA